MCYVPSEFTVEYLAEEAVWPRGKNVGLAITRLPVRREFEPR